MHPPATFKNTAAQRAKSKDISSVGLLWQFIAPHVWRIVFGLVAMVITTVALLMIPRYVQTMFDAIFHTKDVALLQQMVGILCVTAVVLVLGIYARTMLLRYTGVMVIARIQKLAYERVSQLEVGFFESRRTGEIISRLLSDVIILRETIAQQIPMIIRGAFLTIGSLLMLFYTNWQLSLVLLLLVPIALPLTIIFGKRWRRDSNEIQNKMADIGAQVEESLGNIRTVHAFAQVEGERARMDAHVDEAQQIAKGLVRSTAVFFGFNVLAGFATVAVIFWLGGMAVIQGVFSGGQMLAYLLFLAFLSDGIANLSNAFPVLQSAAGATERVFDLLAAEPKIKDPAKPKALKKAKKGRKVAMKNLTFAYPTRPDTPALEALTLDIKAGETVAIVGPSGAGKSSLFSLLMRFYDPQEGTVTVDGEDIRNLTLTHLRHEMALVAQDPTVFSTTVRQNILYGKPDATEEELRQAARIAHATEFIDALPQGYETLVGERGVRLSGGQKQRLAIARTVLRNPQVLLLDEATSHLDAAAEKKVQAAFEDLMKNRTTLIIAHRLATVQAADRILVLNKGQIMAEGTHKQLLKTCPLYKHLAELQFLT